MWCRCSWRWARARLRFPGWSPSATGGHEERLGTDMGARHRSARVLGIALLQLLAVRRADGSGARLEPHDARRRAVAGSAGRGTAGLSRRRLDRPSRRPRGNEPRLAFRRGAALGVVEHAEPGAVLRALV